MRFFLLLPLLMVLGGCDNSKGNYVTAGCRYICERDMSGWTSNPDIQCMKDCLEFATKQVK